MVVRGFRPKWFRYRRLLCSRYMVLCFFAAYIMYSLAMTYKMSADFAKTPEPRRKEEPKGKKKEAEEDLSLADMSWQNDTQLWNRRGTLDECSAPFRPKKCVISFSLTIQKRGVALAQGSIRVGEDGTFSFNSTGGLHIMHATHNCTLGDHVSFTQETETATAVTFLQNLPPMRMLLAFVYGSMGRVFLSVINKLCKYTDESEKPNDVFMKSTVILFEIRKRQHHYLVCYWREVTKKNGGSLYSRELEILFGNPFVISKTAPVSRKYMAKEFPDVLGGGHWMPASCKPRSRVAILVPARNRDKHFTQFLYNMHRFLMSQNLEYGIYAIDQEGQQLFNKAMVMNIGYLEATKDGPYDCFVFHDVDAIPEDLAHSYECSSMPRHLVVARSKLNYELNSVTLEGGFMLRSEHMTAINGLPNAYFGWGGEDDDILFRLWKTGYKVERYPADIASYYSMDQEEQFTYDWSNPYNGIERPQIWARAEMHAEDGLTSLVEVDYKVKTFRRALYTKFLATIPGPRSVGELDEYKTRLDYFDVNQDTFATLDKAYNRFIRQHHNGNDFWVNVP